MTTGDMTRVIYCHPYFISTGEVNHRGIFYPIVSEHSECHDISLNFGFIWWIAWNTLKKLNLCSRHWAWWWLGAVRCRRPNFVSVYTQDQQLKDTRIWHNDVIKWKHFSRYWPFGWGIRRSPVNFPHKGQWRGVLMFYLICAWTGDLRHHRAHYDVTVM